MNTNSTMSTFTRKLVKSPIRNHYRYFENGKRISKQRYSERHSANRSILRVPSRTSSRTSDVPMTLLSEQYRNAPAVGIVDGDNNWYSPKAPLEYVSSELVSTPEPTSLAHSQTSSLQVSVSNKDASTSLTLDGPCLVSVAGCPFRSGNLPAGFPLASYMNLNVHNATQDNESPVDLTYMRNSGEDLSINISGRDITNITIKLPIEFVFGLMNQLYNRFSKSEPIPQVSSYIV